MHKTVFHAAQKIISGPAKFFSTLPAECSAVTYTQFARNVKSVLQKTTLPLPKSLGSNEVLIKMVAAPINPADLNMVEGTYGIHPSLPNIGGIEGCAVVEAAGSAVTSLKTGDRVIAVKSNFGTWRTHAVCQDSDVDKVSSEIPEDYAATILINPCTALRMLKDFVDLKAGDVVIQNAANSAVGRSAIQIAKAKGIKTINLLKETHGTPEFKAWEEKLKSLGADLVLPADSIWTPASRKAMAALGAKPRLLLNSTGGRIATDAARVLGQDGVCVTYGAMSRSPFLLPATSFITSNLTLRGFWLTRWLQDHTASDRQAMYEELYPLIKQGKFKLYFEDRSFKDFDHALDTALQFLGDKKVIMRF